MRHVCLVGIACSFACSAPAQEAADTETESSSSGSESGMMSVTVGTTITTTTSASTTNATTTTTDAVTTDDPDTSDSSESATESTTGECVPAELGCPCDVGSTCTGELTCVDGTCVDEPPCDEPEGEPNDDEASAVELDEASCGGMGMTTDAALNGAESDWFTFHASEGAFCIGGGDPNVALQADLDLAVCIFATCDDGDTSFGCSDGAAESDSPDGVAGCCAQNAVGFDNFSCGFMNQNEANVWVRVTSVDTTCMPYELEWAYDNG
jgi:hypothetical protein